MSHAVSRTSTGYTYRMLVEVGSMASADPINVYGVVTEWSAPKTTRKDLLCTIKITDPSLVNTAANTVSIQDVLVFAPDRAQLPQVLKAGDIIRFHRAKVNHYNGRAQIVCSLGGIMKYGPPASMCLFHSNPTPGTTEEDQPYQRSSQTYHFDAKEKLIIAHLRNFVRSGQWNTGQDAEKYRKLIKDMITSAEEKVVFNDLIGLVMAVESDDSREKVVWMWDGTDSPPYPPKASTNINQGLQPGEEQDPEARAAAALHHRFFPVSSLPPSAAAALPKIGTIVPIIIRDNVVELPAPGTWAKFRNCGFQIAHGQLQGVFAQKSKWIPYHEDEKVLLEYTKRLAEKDISQWYNPGQSLCASTTSHVYKEVTSLRQIAVDSAQPDAQPRIYRCIVRVLSYGPKAERVTSMCVPPRAVKDAAQAEGYTDESEWLFALQLRVVDGSGTELDVDIFGRDGAEFFKDILEPTNLHDDVAARNKLLVTLNYLSGSQTVWLEMCIKSYFPDISEEERKKQQEQGNNASGASSGGSIRPVRYRVFDTKLRNLASS